MSKSTFFDDQMLNSLVKSTIVRKYFYFWAKVIVSRPAFTSRPRNKQWMGYLDLFSGPGTYKDGSESTPIQVIKTAILEPAIAPHIVFSFNDEKKAHCESLKASIAAVPGIETLKVPPRVNNFKVTADLGEYIQKASEYPLLSFVDPFGYKGVSLTLIEKLIHGWGSECILFFNYSAINRTLSNPVLTEQMINIFGEQGYAQLEPIINQEGLDPRTRENLILEHFTDAVKAIGGKYILPFKFYQKSKQRVSHFLMFITKNEFAYAKMKEIMRASCTPTFENGMVSFQFSEKETTNPIIFQYYENLHELKQMLVETFANQTLTVEKIYHQHNLNTPFIISDYKKALKELEEEGIIQVNTEPGKKRRIGAMAEHYIISFPPSPAR